MHIVFLSHEYPLWSSGGIGTFLQTLGRSLVTKGHKVSIVGPGVKSQEEVLNDQGVVLFRLKKNPLPGPNFIYNAFAINKKLRELDQKDPIAIVEASELGLAFINSRLAAKKVIRLHGGHHFFAEAENRGLNWRRGALEKRSFKKADAFIAGTKYVLNHTGKYLSYHTAAVSVIPNPIQTDVAIPKVEVDQNLILFAGTICEKKGVRQLIQAFKLAREKRPSLILELYGREWFYPDGRSYEQSLRSELSKDHFEHVRFMGPVSRPKLDKAYASAAVCVFPSHMETQGLVSLEAMLLERPVVFSKYGPGPETIIHRETGLLADVYEPDDIAAQINWVLDHPAEAEAMGKAARKQVLTNYELEKITEANLNFYRTLLDK